MASVPSTRTCLRSSSHLLAPSHYPRSRSSPVFQPALNRSRSPLLKSTSFINRNPRLFSTSLTCTMSNTFSNADTGDKPADPYKAKNKEDPSLAEKVEGLSKFVDSCKFAMMTTRVESRGLLASRAMAVAGKEDSAIDLLFHTNTESGKTDDLNADNAINISFIDSSGQWASISGAAAVIVDREKVRKHYSPALKAWIGDLGDGTHDGGPEDPRIGVIQVTAKTITYALSQGTFLGRNVEFVKGVVTGEAPNVNKLREISEEECEQWRKTSSK